MPLPRRSPRSTPRASTTVVPRSLQPLLQQTRQTISDQQQAITTLQANMAALITRGNVAPAPRVPLSAAPEKCDLDMTPAAFRSWKRSMECWLLLCKWPRQEAVHHVRLLCGPPLQRALDARFTFDQWSALTQQEALDAIGNPSASLLQPWQCSGQSFFGVSQGQDECVSDYFVRGAQKVNDCAFECPQCSLNLSEYLLLKKLVVGIRDTGLKQQVYQACDSLGSVDALRVMCCAYEAARQHTTGVGGWRESSRAAGTVRAEEDGDQTPDATAATTSDKTQPSRTCWNCGAGTGRCDIYLGGHATQQEVYFVSSARYPALRSPTTDTDANLDEDLTEAVAAVVIATAEHEGHVLDESARPNKPQEQEASAARRRVNPTARTANPAPTNPAGRSTNHDTRTSLNPHPTSATPRTQEAGAATGVAERLCASKRKALSEYWDEAGGSRLVNRDDD
ncbi:hypothetical protein O3P69_016517 [Scylla paramamosain]|uniref:Uncharacterized protein n=1 Tax=Scylla paramamosain TaxID=85552 RepID=A0AAW0TGP2_SCYPA